MKSLLIVTAFIELGAGLALLGCPSAMAAFLVGAPLESPAALTVARIGGGALLALGTACWLARDDVHSPTARGLVAAMALYDIVAVAVLAFARIGLGLQGAALWAAAALHAAMTVWCALSLRRTDHRENRH